MRARARAPPDVQVVEGKAGIALLPPSRHIDCRVCFCSEGEVDNGDDFYNKLLELKADNKRRLAVLEAQLNGEVKTMTQISLKN